MRPYVLDPPEYGFELCGSADLKGGDAVENARITERVLAGDLGPKRDVVILNAAAAIYVAGIAPDLGSAIEAARTSIDSGRATAVLQKLRELSKGA
jgi:anthranilate phosphoribosyltransferase